MKIFVLGTRGFPDVLGGIEKHCEKLLPRIAALGVDITVITRSPYIDSNKRYNEWKGVRFVHIWCPRIKAFEAITHSILGVFVAKYYSADVLHLHAVGPSIVAPLARLLGIKVVVTHHGPDYERAKWGKFAKIFLKFGEKMGVKYSNKLIVISEVIKNHISNEYKKSDSVLIPNGINIYDGSIPDNLLTEYNLVKNSYIFTACRFVPEKGLHDLVNAYSKLSLKNVKLVIAGDADHETEYSRSFKKLATENNVILTGNLFKEKLACLFKNAGLFVLPSYYEGLPIALLEAMSFDLPVLVSNIPQHKEVNLIPNRYFKLGDVADLTKKIEELFPLGISDKEKEQYSLLIETKYNWDKIAEATYQIYKSLT